MRALEGSDGERLMSTGFTTIGHSKRGLEEFLEMLRQARVELLVDVRSFPRSRNNPIFNIDRLPDDLALIQIAYRHFPELGGRRPKQLEVDPALNGLWRVQSFHNYADYALGPAFGDAFNTLIELGREQRVALMCSEAVWWRCHRRIITDYLLFRGETVAHLMAIGKTVSATPTPGARPLKPHHVIYPGRALENDQGQPG